MSYRFDTPLISGAYHFGNRGLGVLGSEIASTGTNGPGYIYNDLTLPADANKEYSGFVETPPGVGTFFAFEDSSFTYSGPTTSFVYRLREDGVDKGTQTVNINTDETPAGAMSWLESNDTCNITANIPYVSSMSWAEANDTTSITAALSGIIGATSSWVESDDSLAVTISLRDNLTANWSEANDTCAISGTVVSVVDDSTIVWSEANDVSNIVATVASSNATSSITWTEANDITIVVAAIPVTTSASWIESNDSYNISMFVEGAGTPLPANIQVKFKSNKYKIKFRRG